MTTCIRMTRLASAMSLGIGALTLVACQSPPVKNPEVDSARLQLSQLEGDPQLASRAPVAIKDAETAVAAAEVPTKNAALKSHLAILANNKVKTAHALASARYAEDQLKNAASERGQIQLAARTQEADQANAQAKASMQQANAATQQADISNQQAEISNQQANDANAMASKLADELAALHAKKTSRGLVISLSDVVFATNRANLKPGATANFDRLAVVLDKEPNQHITVEGHTDNVGRAKYNMRLSQRRADAVKDYLVSQGVHADRITAVGKGEDYPVTSNSTAAGRQKNRRVEVIIENSPIASN